MNCAGDVGCLEIEPSEEQDQMHMWMATATMRLSGQFCDTALVVGGVKFPAHRAILAANSPYFRKLFTGKLSSEPQRDVKIAGIDPATMSVLLDYVYTRKLQVTMGNIEKVLHQAERLMINGISNHCRVFLLSVLNTSNALQTLKLAKTLANPDSLVGEISRYVRQNFLEIVSSSMEYLLLPPEELLNIISDDELNVKSEEDVFEAVVQWVDHKPMARISHMPKLLSKVRMGYVHPEYFIEKISAHRYVRAGEDSGLLMRNVWKIMCRPHQQREEAALIEAPYPLLPRIPQQMIFVVGGWSGGNPVSFFETFDKYTNRWLSHAEFEDEYPRAYHGTVAIENRIYVLGGFDGAHYYNTIRAFDTTEKAWMPLAPMYFQRCYVSATVSDGLIYACGGFDGRWRLDSAERYDPASNRWELLPDMLERRSDASAASIFGKVYVTGGFDGEECLSTAEVFDPETYQWTLIAEMSFARSGVITCSLHGFLFAFGGFDGQRRLCSGEKYCPVTKTWYPVEPMSVCRSNGASVVMDDKIFVLGGFNGNFTVSKVSCYDDERDYWSDDICELTINRSAMCACVVNTLENARDYTRHGFF